MGGLIVPLLGSLIALNTLVDLLEGWMPAQRALLPYVVFVGLFFGLLMAMAWLESTTKRLLRPTFIGRLDCLLGGILGALKWGMYSSMGLGLLKIAQIKIPTVYTQKTWLLPMVETLYPRLLAWSTTWLPHVQAWLSHNG